MSNFLKVVKNNCVDNKQGKLFYFLGISFAIILSIVFLIIFILPLASPYTFFAHRESYDEVTRSLKNKYLPERNIRFQESYNYKYTLNYKKNNENLHINVNMVDKTVNSNEHYIEYVFDSGKFIIKYTSRKNGKEIYNATFTKKNDEFAIHIKYLIKLSDNEINSALTAIELSTIALENYACPYINQAISEYIEFNHAINAIFGAGLTFFIFFLAICCALIAIYILASKMNISNKNVNYQHLQYLSQEETIESFNNYTKTIAESTTLLTSETIATLKKYKELLDKEIITENEFKSIKSKLLNL